MSRLGRGEMYTIAEYELSKRHIFVEMVKEKFAADLAGYMTKTMTTMMDGFYPKMVGQWTRTKMERMVERGYHCGGITPFGYKTETVTDAAGFHAPGKEPPKRLVPDEEKAPLVRNAYNMATRRAGMNQIARYLTATSDLVALMTFEHQTQMSNFIVRVGWLERQGIPPSAREIDDLVAYLTFAEEAPLREPVHGVSQFTRTFPQRGPRDSHGLSLRDFDLEHRLFRYPLSYLIYSAAFDALPDRLRERIYSRLFEVLSGRDQSPRFSWAGGPERRAALEILRETKPDLPASFGSIQVR